MRQVGGPRVAHSQMGTQLASGRGISTKFSIEWERRSPRLWVGEKDGRSFRIERVGTRGGIGTVVAREVDDKYKAIRSEPSQSATTAKALIETWL